MNWLAKAKAHFSEMAQASTDKTDEKGVLSVSSVPTGRVYEDSNGVSSVSSVGVTGIFENCISVEELIAAALRACDHHGDNAAAQQQMVKDCLNTRPELRQELLDYFSTNYPRPTP
ncbi:MAG: hypothetical protein R3E52_13470 [Burkholderiaceae bacterium]